MSQDDNPPPATGPRDSHNVVARRKRLLRPFLHPVAGRRLPPELQPEPVYARALSLSGGVGDPAFADLLQLIDQGPWHRDTDIRPYFDGAGAFDDMLAAVRAARREVLLEAYIISGDATGREFVEALSAAVARGVAVYVLADAFGSSRTRRNFWSLMRQGGSRFRLFRRPAYAPLPLLPVLDHRKLLVVDREVAFTGGMNIADEYRGGSQGEPAWRDTHVRVTGRIAWECALLFDESWQAAGGDPLQFRGRDEGEHTGATCLLLDSRPGRGAQEVHSAVAAIMGAARERLWITNAYFAPSPRILKFLKATARRGVDLRLLLPQRSDIPLIQAAARGYYSELMACGVRIYEYRPSVLHAKTVLADDRLCMIGSTNFDFRSFALNHECNVLSLDSGLGQAMHDQFLRDLDQAVPIDPARWTRRRWWQWLASALARLLAPLL